MQLSPTMFAGACALALTAMGACVADTGVEPEQDVDLGAPGQNASALAGNFWGPMVELRDDTSTFPSAGGVAKPQGGWWVTPIHTTLMTNGKVLITGWGRRDKNFCGDHGMRQTGTSWVLDPNALPNGGTLYVQPMFEDQTAGTREVLYCSGHTPMSDGRILYTGGARYVHLGETNEEEYGLNYARIFNPATTSFSRVASPMVGGPAGMEGMAWYPTNTRLPDGKVMVIGGFSRCCDTNYTNRAISTFDPKVSSGSPWTLVANHDSVPWEVGPGLRDYVHTFVLPTPVVVDGFTRDIAMVGAAGKIILGTLAADVPASRRFVVAPNGTRPWASAGWDSTAALLSSGEIMIMGGTDNNDAARRIDLYRPETGSWRSFDTGIGRRNPASVLLPDGTVLITNGGNDERGYPGDRRRVQIFDPASGSITSFDPWAGDNYERGYHSFALLLKDGRVLLGGGISPLGGIACERPDLRIYNPPYFSKGAQPQFVNAPATTTMKLGGAAVTMTMAGEALKPQGGVALLALSSTTHAFDQNQRYVRLTYTRTGDQLTITPPANGNLAPPGDYIMYLVTQAGVPSSGVHVRVEPAAVVTPPSDIRRTVIFMKGQTVVGQDMFVRGGLDHDAMLRLRGVSCTASNYACAIPFTHRNLRNATTAPWKAGERYLDWYGREATQTGGTDTQIQGTPADWTTNNAANPNTVAVQGYGYEPLNQVGDHLWMVDVDMDCGKGFVQDGKSYFEVKSFISNGPGWEPDVTQAATPYPTRNHVGQCGKINVFERGSSAATIRDF